MRIHALLCLAGLIGAVPLAQAQLPPDKALATMKAGEGLQVELFAAEPMLINPTSIDVDHKGRVWVAEGVNYRRLPFGWPTLRNEGDRIQILIDKDGDGKADEAQTFYQGKELIAPLSVLVLPLADLKGLRVLVAQSPNILEFWDRDGDLKADGPPTKFLTGFGGIDHDHGVHGLSVGPDGKLYFTVGDSGVTGLQSSDGKGRKFVSNNTDVHKGTAWRCDLDGKNLELIAHNFRNNYEACVDSFGEIWLSDNDDDGNQQTRICHVYPGGNYGYGPRGPGQTHWHEEQPGIVHKTLRTGFGSPTGICFYEGTLLPKMYQGDLIHADAGPREIRYFKRTPKGAGYELEKINMLTSSDTWFRPSDVCVAPDGSVMVSDWYDPGVGGHGMGDWTRGRIYRLTPAGHKGYKTPEVKLDSKEGLLAALASPNMTTRSMVHPTIAAAPEKDVKTLGLGLVEGAKTEISLARGLWQIAQFTSDHVSVKYDERLLKEPLAMNTRGFDVFSSRNDPTAIKQVCLEFGDAKASDQIKQVSPAARRETLLLMRKEPDAAVVAPAFYALAKLYDGKDIFYRAALNIACGTDPVRREKILADFEKQFPEWNDQVADLVWELRPKSMLAKMDRLLTEGKLNAAQKGRIVDILAVSDSEDAGKTLIKLLKSEQPAEVKTRALENLRLFLPTKWSGLGKTDELKTAIHSLLQEQGTIGVGLQLVAAANDRGSLDKVIELAKDKSVSSESRIVAIRTLGKLRDMKAIEALFAVGHPENPLSVECVQAMGEYLTGNLNSLPPSGQKALEYLGKAVDSRTATITLKTAALNTLAGSRAGTGWLLQQQEKKALTPEVTAVAGRLLRNSPFQGERNKAMILFPLKLDPKKLPAISDLAKKSGNAERGKALMAKSLTGETQCLKCHTVRGIGGQIGPDLSSIGTKASRENLIESILQPSKAIADQFVSWKINTADGQTITGLLVLETPTHLTLRDANGKDYVIAFKDVESRSKSLISLMPEGLIATLTEEELLDVVEYLMTLKDAVPTKK